MGVYYTADTIIGYRVSDPKRFDICEVQNCGHNPPTDVKYCPDCGVKVGTHAARKWLPAWDVFDEAMQKQLPHGLKYAEDLENLNAFWIGYGCIGVGPCDAVMTPVLPYDTIKALTRALIEPYVSANLFTLDENQFGIWTINIGR